MIGKKRGLLLLVLVMALMVVSVVGVESIRINDDKVASLGKYLDPAGCVAVCNGGVCKDCWYDNNGLWKYGQGYELIYEGGTYGAERVGVTVVENPGGCSNADDYHIRSPQNIVQLPGCWIIITDQDGGADPNDGARAIMDEGFIFDNDWQRLTDKYSNSAQICGGGGDPKAGFKYAKFKSDQENTYLCGYDGYWHTCIYEDTEGTLGTLMWANNIAYNCTMSEETDLPFWNKIGGDPDHDGYTSPGDCEDNIGKDPTNCPTDLEDETCVYPDHSKCAICINPGAPETCGDGIDNNCNGIEDDTCNNFREGCIQEAIIEDNLEDGDWVDVHYNIHGISFPWVKTGPNEGFCCGFNGTDDLGKIVTGISDENGGDNGEFVCLNTELTGAEVTIPGGEEEGGYCKGKWCLSNAVGGPTAGGKFTIFTVKPLGENPYDIVSNGESWLTCNETSVGWLQDYPLTGIDEEYDSAVVQSIVNRFYCYDEGDHYSWAECANEFEDRKNKGVKGRYPGDGLYSLPLSKDGLVGGIKVSSSGVHKVDIIAPNNYDSFYDDEHLLDFTDYKYLNFMVQFCDGDCNKEDVLSLEELKLQDYIPLNIELSLLDADDAVLLKKSVLGDITNSPQFDPEVWLHIKTEIPDGLKGVRTISIDPAVPSRMRMRNVYLSRDDDAELCSGKDAQDESSWILDMDQGSSKEDITGEDLCKALYGGTAWLGKDGQIDNSFLYANCCGDDPNEYYAGPSVGEEDKFACWNSQTIKDKETSTNVEFEIEYKEEEYDVEEIKYTSSVRDSLSWEAIMKLSSESIVSKPSWDWYDTPGSWGVHPTTPGVYPILVTTLSPKEFCTLNGFDDVINFSSTDYNEDGTVAEYSYDYGGQWYDYYPNNPYVSTKYYDPKIITEILCGSGSNTFGGTSSPLELSISNKQEIVGFIIPQEILSGGGYGKSQIKFNYEYDDKFNLKLYDGQNWEEVGTETEEGELTLTENEVEDLWYSKIYVIIELKPETQTLEITPKSPSLPKLKSYSYSCSDKECLYPLPGDPLKERTIKNLYPELYDLYFVSYNTETEDIEEDLINGENKFYKSGNVIAKKVSQQIIFVADEDEGLDSKFYGCQAADYILNNENASIFLEDQQHCSLQGDGFFCAPSVNVPAIGNQDQYTLVNSWSDESLSKVGYADDSNTENFEDFKTYFDSLVLQLKTPDTLIEPTDRNYTTSVVPFRNIIPNAEFRNSGGEIPHWEILENNKVVSSEVDYTDEENDKMIRKLIGSETLKSEKIAMNQSGIYYVWLNGTADFDIYNDKGNLVTVNSDGTFEPNSQFIIIEFSKGTVYQPFLQLVDDLGIGEYNYAHQEEMENFDFRSGLSCCKPDQCWNGYTCVEPMENMAIMTEHFGTGKDYRCIDGQWTHLPVKWDWNNQKWGFCSQEEQCFVTKNGEADNTIISFLDEGKAPICINSNESILDHYCETGQWTSRTKFLASKLVEVAGNDEFILYCTNYKKSLLHPGNEIYLGGKSQDKKEEVPGLGGFTENPQNDELSYTCFEDIWLAEDGKDLVPQDENTCINNMCVLRYTEGGQFKTAFATTLNKNINNTESSFLLEFDVGSEDLNTICAGEGDFVKCNFDAADMWYSKDLNAIVYGRQVIQLSGGIFGNAINGFIDWFKDLAGIGTDLPEYEQFIFESKNFNEIYLLDKDGKKVKVVREAVNGSDIPQQSILAEYEGFTTPLCEYVNKLEVPLELKTELLEEYDKYNCTSEEGKQKLQLIVNEDDSEGLDFFWPQITGKLRVGSFD
jgi:hypothetical protein